MKHLRWLALAVIGLSLGACVGATRREAAVAAFFAGDKPQTVRAGPHDHLLQLDSTIARVQVDMEARYAEATFTIHNPSDIPFALARLHPYCGCTVVGTVPRLLGPGASMTIPVRIIVDRKLTMERRFVQVVLVGKTDERIEYLLGVEIQRMENATTAAR